MQTRLPLIVAFGLAGWLCSGADMLAQAPIALPEPVPYLNAKHRYVLGNGVVFVVGDGSGAWANLNGPGYTGSNLIQSETLSLKIDGAEQALSFDMKRARETGIYYGVATVNGLKVRLIDYAPLGDWRVSRRVEIDNTSPNPHEVSLTATVKFPGGGGRTAGVVNEAGKPAAFFIKNDKTVEAAGWMGNNVADRSVVIAFSEPATASVVSGTASTATNGHRLGPHESWQTTLCHQFEKPGTSDETALAGIRQMNHLDDLAAAIRAWQAWYRDVAPEFSLDRIKDARARDLVEGGLAVLKANQSADGGLMADSTCYIECYPRDDALGLRGLAATGHFDELKKWLIWVDAKIPLWGHLADSYSGEPSLKDGTLHLDLGDCNVEETAYYILAARDYYHATKDLATLDRVRGTLGESMDVQLEDAVAQDYRLDFEGDETEGCSAGGTVPTDGTPLKQWGDTKTDFWSMPSVAMCSAALDFYIKYLELHHENPHAYKNSLTHTTMDLPDIQKKLLAALERDYWRTDVPAFPGGFHEFARRKKDNAWPDARVVNFTLMPIFFGTPCDPARKKADVEAMAAYFNPQTGFLPLFPPVEAAFDGHDLGYLLWGLVEIDDPRKEQVYHALVNGPTADCWGSFTEGYDAAGKPNDHDLRTLETGVNVSAISKYWGLGK